MSIKKNDTCLGFLDCIVNINSKLKESADHVLQQDEYFKILQTLEVVSFTNKAATKSDWHTDPKTNLTYFEYSHVFRNPTQKL